MSIYCDIKDVDSAPGWGEYDPKVREGETRRIALCVAKIALFFLVGVALAAFVAVSVIFCPLSLIASIPVTALGYGIASYQIFLMIKEVAGIRSLAPSTAGTYAEIARKIPSLEVWDDKGYQCYLPKGPRETFQTMKELIKVAEREILLSNSYCGRAAFDACLGGIEQRMGERGELQVYILAADRFLTDQNRKKIDLLKEKYGDRFFLVYTSEFYQADLAGSEIKRVSSHVKLMIVDRRAMVTGGSGLSDRWVYSDGIAPVPVERPSFLEKMAGQTFRDKDFVFWSDRQQTLIDTAALQFYCLLTRWHYYSSSQEHALCEFKAPSEIKEIGWKIQNVPSFQNPSLIRRMKLFALGPEQTTNTLAREAVRLIDEAKENIVFNHMYIHPTDQLLDALKRAAKRGVKITILTNSSFTGSPFSHKLFAPRSVYHVRQIASSAANAQQIQFYLWTPPKSTHHKKILFIDDRCVLCGTSNFGYKGFCSMSDYECNLLIDSPELCQQLRIDLEEDLQNAEEMPDTELHKAAGLKERFFTSLHKTVAPIIG